LDRQVLLAHGIEPEYIDIWSRTHSTSDATARAILESLGEDRATASIPPAVVVREDADAIEVRIPADSSGTSMKLEIRWENGDLEHHWFFLPELPSTQAGEEVVVKRVPLPKPLRPGYHQLQLYWMREPQLESFAKARFIVCPKRAYGIDGRIAGVAVSLYGLRTSRNWGCGDFTDLRAAIDAFAPAGVAFIALNPLHAIPNRQPYNTSPYLPQCSFYRNFIYLDVERIGDTSVDLQEVEALRATEFVEYERVATLKINALRAIFERFAGSPEFDRYIASEGAILQDFAVFCALDEELHRRDPNVWLWTDWPEEYRDPRSPAVARFAEEHARDVVFYKFLQWHIDRQLAEVQAHALEKGMRLGVYHDLALATDRFGADLWMNRRFYSTGCRVGAPPDDFSPNGQDWAFPPPNRDAHRANGYELFAQLIRNTARHGGALRIDHVMRFFRLWWIPDGMPASEGAYVRDYSDDLLGVLALESVRGKFIVIGEDLGTVTGEVRQALSEAGVLSYRVLWFERNSDGSFRRPDEYPAQAAASTTTHDLATMAGFAIARDIEARRAAGLIDEAAYQHQLAARQEEIRRLNAGLAEAGFAGDPIGFLFSTPCALAIVNQEDLTGETEQQNLPGSTWQHPNWRRKMKVPVEEFSLLAEVLHPMIESSGRR
jgi:4-alpha-glucanotransferase